MEVILLVLVIIIIAALCLVVWALALAVKFVLYLLLQVYLSIGDMGDYAYDQQMLRGKVPYRLPFRYRVFGWEVCPQGTSGSKVVLDRRINCWVSIVRSFDPMDDPFQ